MTEDWQFYNKIWQDNEGKFYIVMYPAYQPITGNDYVVYFKVEEKQTILVLPKYLFVKSFTYHEGISDAVVYEL